ncbi:hypothetical protein HZH68_006937 [Vespula germanica]|uniref:Uncharacterized protein n=1 Tax=Vespula germanica TaxID=30212 RepID=A0A834N9G1_VESGE|nr:hypothetical protein HZH68_006937 [Vespula germanica]
MPRDFIRGYADRTATQVFLIERREGRNIFVRRQLIVATYTTLGSQSYNEQTHPSSLLPFLLSRRKLFAFLKDEDEEEEDEEEEDEEEDEEEEEKQKGRGEGWKRNKGGRTPGVLASWHPCGLIYGLQLTSLEPASSRECSTENHPTWYIATNIREQARLDGSYFANEAKDLYLSTPYSSRRIDANGQKRDWKGDVLVIETPLTLYFSEFDLIPL